METKVIFHYDKFVIQILNRQQLVETPERVRGDGSKW